MIIAAILKNVLSGGTKSNDSKAMRPRSRGDAARDNRLNDMMKTIMRSNEKDDRRNRAPAGPTPEQQVASARAAEKEAKIKKGKARRKKYEAAQTMAKKMKLIFVD